MPGVRIALFVTGVALGFVLGVQATQKLFYAKPCRGCGAKWTRHHTMGCEFA